MPFFFFSYSQKNNHPYLDQFYRDVVEQVQGRQGAANVVFRDVENVHAGGRWDDEVARALRQCGVMVCLHTADYLQSEACGKEYSVFRRRVVDYRKARELDTWPPLILPVPWIRLEPQKQLVADRTIISVVQGLPEAARTKGVWMLARDRATNPAPYHAVVDNLVNAICDAFRDHPLTEAPSLPPWDELENGFEQKDFEAAETSSLPVDGPDLVHFVFVAPSRAELHDPRYGVDSRSWRPFQPPDLHMIKALADQVAGGENFIAENLRPVDEILEIIDVAEARNNIVVVVVDPWATGLATYQKLLRALDRRASRHVAVVVPWNSSHEETVRAREALRASLSTIFANRLDPKDPRTFLDEIETPEAFRTELRKALTFLRARAQKGPGPTRPMPGTFGPLPTLSGPGGGK